MDRLRHWQAHIESVQLQHRDNLIPSGPKLKSVSGTYYRRFEQKRKRVRNGGMYPFTCSPLGAEILSVAFPLDYC